VLLYFAGDRVENSSRKAGLVRSGVWTLVGHHGGVSSSFSSPARMSRLPANERRAIMYMVKPSPIIITQLVLRRDRSRALQKVESEEPER
jgi:hypothetical protein